MSIARQPDQRFTPSNPCPICGGNDRAERGQGHRCHGFRSGNFVHCSREEHAGSAPYFEGSQTWAHLMEGECSCGRTHNPPVYKITSKSARTWDSTYAYRDEAAEVLFEVVKFRNPKSFTQRRPDPSAKGGYVYKLGEVRRVLYRLPEILAAEARKADEILWFVESEKSVERLAELGLLATCSPHGAGKFRAEFAEFLAGWNVVILPDNDKPGRDHAEDVARKIHKVAASVKVVELPGLADAADVFDFLETDGSVADLKRLAEAAAPWTRKPIEAKSNGNELPATIPMPCSPKGFNLTDLGNAERLMARHGINLRYCHPWKKWLCYDGKRWSVDNTAMARRWAKDTVRSMYREAAATDDSDRRKELVAHAQDSEKRDRMAAMLNVAEMECPILSEEMDLDPWAFNCANGTVDLKTGKLQPHRREDYFTKLCKVKFNPDATCPLWESTLNFFFGNDPVLIAYFQRICGYSMSGEIRDHLLPICYGDGSNGKSTLLGTLLEVLGIDYAMKATGELLMAKKHATHSTDKTDLFGKRLVIAIETQDGRGLDETTIKELTGGDRIRARRMREDNWEFMPTHTFMLATNHKPEIKGDDNGIWRRLRLIPFLVQVSDKDADKSMSVKLKDEYPGILAWCVRGCLAWQAEGLHEPDVVTKATADYRKEQDSIGRFLEEATIKFHKARVKAGVLYEQYTKWAEAANERKVLSMKAFGMDITKRGIEKETGNFIFYLGIGLRSETSFQQKPTTEIVEGVL